MWLLLCKSTVCIFTVNTFLVDPTDSIWSFFREDCRVPTKIEIITVNDDEGVDGGDEDDNDDDSDDDNDDNDQKQEQERNEHLKLKLRE